MVGARCAPGGPNAARDANKVGGAAAGGRGYFALGGAFAMFIMDGAVPKAVLELATAAATRECWTTTTTAPFDS